MNNRIRYAPAWGRAIVSVSVALLLLAGCGGGSAIDSSTSTSSGSTTSNTSSTGTAGSSTAGNGTAGGPSTGGSSNGTGTAGTASTGTVSSQGITVNYKLQPSVRLFSETEAATVKSVLNDGTELVLGSGSPVEPNMIFIANGAAFKVTSVSTVNGESRAVVSTPNLRDVFDSFSASGSVDATQLTSVPSSSIGAIRESVRGIHPNALGSLPSLHYDVPIKTGPVTGKVGIDMSGTFLIDINFTSQGNFEKAITQFTGIIALDGSLTTTKPVAKTSLIKQTFSPPCLNFLLPTGLIPIPSSICAPISIGVDFSSDIASTLPVSYSQRFVAGLTYPNAPATPNTDATPSETVPILKDLTLSNLVKCASLNVTLSNYLSVEPQFNLLKTFKIASLPSSLTYAGTLKTRLNQTKTPPAPDFSFNSNINANIQAQLGVAIPMPDSIAYNGSLIDFVAQKAKQVALSKLINGINDFVFFKTTLLDLTIPVSDTPPLAACITVEAKPLTATGQPTVVNLDTDSTSDPRVKTTITGIDPSGKPLTGLGEPGTSFNADSPGTYVVTITRTNDQGKTTTQTENYSLVPAGNYAGQFFGGDSGSGTVQISPSGAMVGNAVSAKFGSSISATGQVSPSGSFYLSGGTTGGATFDGKFVPTVTGWKILGTWGNRSSGLSGTFEFNQIL